MCGHARRRLPQVAGKPDVVAEEEACREVVMARLMVEVEVEVDGAHAAAGGSGSAVSSAPKHWGDAMSRAWVRSTLQGPSVPERWLSSCATASSRPPPIQPILHRGYVQYIIYVHACILPAKVIAVVLTQSASPAFVGVSPLQAVPLPAYLARLGHVLGGAQLKNTQLFILWWVCVALPCVPARPCALGCSMQGRCASMAGSCHDMHARTATALPAGSFP